MTGKKPNEPQNSDADQSATGSAAEQTAWEEFGQANEAQDNDSGAQDWQAQLQEANDKALRYQAELDNFRRRTRREMEEQLKYACLPLINDLLEVQDNLQRALEAAADQANSGLAQGVQMVAMQLSQLLNAKGCHQIETVGCNFDPNAHQAAQMVHHEDVPVNQIIQELRAGYRLHDRVIRPAQVVISKGPNSAG